MSDGCAPAVLRHLQFRSARIRENSCVNSGRNVTQRHESHTLARFVVASRRTSSRSHEWRPAPQRLIYWPTTTTFSYTGFPNYTWNSKFWGGDFRWTRTRGLHLKYATGNESSWSAGYGATAGTGTVWSGDVFYAWQLPAAILRGFVGNGSNQYNSTFGPLYFNSTNNGYRVGAEAVFPIPNTAFQINAAAAWFPSINAQPIRTDPEDWWGRPPAAGTPRTTARVSNTRRRKGSSLRRDTGGRP